MHATSFDAAVRSARATARVALACGAVVLLAMLAPLAVADDTATMRLQQDPREILEAVARQMNVTLRSDEPLPQIHLESTAPLEQFQDAVESQWNFRPPRFANVYAVASNEIYLTDDPGYYRRVRRTLDESLAQAMHAQLRLLLEALDRHESHVRPLYRFADRRRIGGVVLATLAG